MQPPVLCRQQGTGGGVGHLWMQLEIWKETGSTELGDDNEAERTSCVCCSSSETGARMSQVQGPPWP